MSSLKIRINSRVYTIRSSRRGINFGVGASCRIGGRNYSESQTYPVGHESTACDDVARQIVARYPGAQLIGE